MGKVERHGDAGNAVGREPFLGQPYVRMEADAAQVELAIQALDTSLDPGSGQGQPEIAEAQVEQRFGG